MHFRQITTLLPSLPLSPPSTPLLLARPPSQKLTCLLSTTTIQGRETCLSNSSQPVGYQFQRPWGSSESPTLTTSWAPPELGSAASDLFGMPAAWHHELQTNEHHFVDLIQQICSLKILSGGTFLATELHRKHIRWKSLTRRAMVAAATFKRSRNLTDLTNPQQSPPRSEFTALSQPMTVYLSDQGDDLLPIVIDSGASISLTANYNNFVGPIRPATIT